MMGRGQPIRRNLLVLAVTCALGAPLASYAAQSQVGSTGASATAASRSAREQQLEQRVNQLQRELEQLKAEVQAQRAAPPPPRQVVEAKPAESFKPVFTTGKGISVALHGFIDATAFSQNKSFTFGNGQSAEFPVPDSRGSLSGVDVRNTRFWLDFTGPNFADNWFGGGRIEMDFFGGFNGTGAFSQQQATPRLRQAYVYVEHPSTGTTLSFGQQWDLMFPLAAQPVSISHIAWPLGYGTGMIGWRYPGVVLKQDFNPGTAGVKWGVDVGVFEGSWDGPGNNINFLTAGNVGFHPQVEARLRAQGDEWTAFAVAHYSHVDLRGVGATAPTPVKSSFSSTAFELGGKWTPGTWVFTAAGYTGRGIGELFGDLAQFGDIKDTGAYVQIGDHFTPHWSAYAFYAASMPNKNEVVRWMGNGAVGRLRTRQSALSVVYTSGPYDFGVDFLHAKLRSTTNGLDRTSTSGNQLSLSAAYHF